MPPGHACRRRLRHRAPSACTAHVLRRLKHAAIRACFPVAPLGRCAAARHIRAAHGARLRLREPPLQAGLAEDVLRGGHDERGRQAQQGKARRDARPR